MRPRRIYLPLTPDQLRALAAERALAAPATGYAAAAPGRVDARISPAAAQEEAEYVAFRAAAREAAYNSGGRRRIVAAADAPAGSHRETSADGARPVEVVTTEDLPLRFVVSLHLDEDRRAEGAGGADSDDGSGTGADDATVGNTDDGTADDTGPDEESGIEGDVDGGGEELDLLWYDITELDAVIAELDR